MDVIVILAGDRPSAEATRVIGPNMKLGFSFIIIFLEGVTGLVSQALHYHAGQTSKGTSACGLIGF